MPDQLTIHLCQSDPSWQSPQKSLCRLDELTAGLQTDLLVLPEFFSTGFTMDARFAEPQEGSTLAWMRATAKRIHGAVAGSIPVQEEGRYYNRLYFCKPDGSQAHYDKKHIFSIGNESQTYSPGSAAPIVQWRGWRIRLSTCYDLRFPVWLRNRHLEYDLLLNVASWPGSRIRTANLLNQARSIENQCYTVFCNRFGEEPELSYSGGSCIVDFKGEHIIPPHYDTPGLLSAKIAMEPLLRFREKFPAWKDQDDFTLTSQ